MLTELERGRGVMKLTTDQIITIFAVLIVVYAILIICMVMYWRENEDSNKGDK